ncbi:hypothetical protein GOV08_01830 [Candidatus Woesearchaeota archaeon]|nr:hypothetical protein [Candidatus Woesearchaeota archaeon]
MAKKDENFLDKLKRSLHIINKNKRLFIILIVSTIIMVLLTTLITYKYSLSAITHQQEVFDYINSINTTNPTQSLGEDPLEIYRHIQGVKTALITMSILLGIAFFIFSGINWGITKLMTKKKDFKEYLKAFSATFIAYAVPFSIFFYLTFKLAFRTAAGEISIPGINALSWIFLLIILYFFYISLALTTNTKLSDIPKKTLKNALNFKITAPVFLSTIFLVSLFSYSIFLFAEGNFILLLMLIFLQLTTLSFSKVLFAVSFD